MPNLNSIGHLFDELGKMIAARRRRSITRPQGRNPLKTCMRSGNAIQQDCICRLVQRGCSRCQALLWTVIRIFFPVAVTNLLSVVITSFSLFFYAFSCDFHFHTLLSDFACCCVNSPLRHCLFCLNCSLNITESS